MFDVKLVIGNKLQEKMEKALDAFQNLINAQAMSQQSMRAYTSIGPVPYPSTVDPPTEDEKKTVEVWLEAMGPVIEQEAINTVKQEIQQLMLRGGNVKRVAEELKKGKKPRLVRKKEGRRDPLFLQMGDGVEEPIEEIHIFG